MGAEHPRQTESLGTEDEIPWCLEGLKVIVVKAQTVGRPRTQGTKGLGAPRQAWIRTRASTGPRGEIRLLSSKDRFDRSMKNLGKAGDYSLRGSALYPHLWKLALGSRHTFPFHHWPFHFHHPPLGSVTDIPIFMPGTEIGNKMNPHSQWVQFWPF